MPMTLATSDFQGMTVEEFDTTKLLAHAARQSRDDSGKSAAKDKMVALLNRRNYIRNLVRDVNEALGE